MNELYRKAPWYKTRNITKEKYKTKANLYNNDPYEFYDSSDDFDDSSDESQYCERTEDDWCQDESTD